MATALLDLQLMDRAELAERWQSVMRRRPPKASSRVFLLKALAYELQVKQSANLSKQERKTLKASLGKTSAAGKPLEREKRPPRLALVPGSRLVREWNGKPYSVSVIEEGFV